MSLVTHPTKLVARPDHGVAVPIWRANEDPETEPAFWLMFYDLARTGSGIVRAALRRRRLDPDEWWTSFWFIQ